MVEMNPCLQPVFISKEIMDIIENRPFWSTWQIKRKYGKRPEITIDKLVFPNDNIFGLIPRVPNGGLFK